MKPVYQTVLAPPDGNCFAACVASILEMSIEDVPNYTADDWYERWQEWFAQLNLTLVTWPHSGDEGWMPKGYTILGSRPPGCSFGHASVALDGKPVWNPFPGYGKRIGDIGEYSHWTLFAVLDPSKPGGKPLDA